MIPQVCGNQHATHHTQKAVLAMRHLNSVTQAMNDWLFSNFHLVQIKGNLSLRLSEKETN